MTRDRNEGPESCTDTVLFRKLAHDLKTPMSALELQLAVIGSDPGLDSVPTLRDALSVLARCSGRAVALADLLAWWARARDGAVEPPREPTDLGPLLERTASWARSLSRSANGDLATEVSGEHLVAVDAELVRCLLRAMMVDAMGRADHGGIARVELSSDGERAVVRVHDHGPPLPHRHYGLVFDAPSSDEGLGIGVTPHLLRRLAAQAGGEVDLQPSGRGSVMSLSLPVHARASLGEPAPNPEPSSAPRIAIVEDDRDLRRGLGALLRADGFEVSCFGRGEHLLAQLRRPGSGRFDAVLLDHRLPGASGLQTLRELHRSGLDLPVVMMTAYDDQVATAAREMGALAVFGKPLDPDDLRTAMLHWTRSRRRRSSAPPSTPPAP